MTVSPGYWRPATQIEAMNQICTSINDAAWFDASGLVEVERLAPLLRPDMRVLDFAGGIGRVTRHLAPRVASVTLVDSSPEMLGFAEEWCAGLPNVSFVRSAQPLPFEDGSFDLICAYMIFFHLHHDTRDYGWWLDEMHRVLVPGGYLVFDVDLGTSYPPIDTALWEIVAEETLTGWPKDTAITARYRTLRALKPMEAGV